MISTVRPGLFRAANMSSRALSTLRLVIGGVPEQVNIPLQRAVTSPEFRRHGVDVQLQWVPEGTGAMIDKVVSGDLDLALTVTDGMIAGIAQGKPIELAGIYVQSPLTWAVASSPTSPVQSIPQLANGRMGVSRLGSGSHTMSFYMGLLHGFDPKKLQFIVANNFTQLRKGVSDSTFDAFLWETFTTQPYFSSGELRKIGDIETPWPSFSFVCNPTKLTKPQSQVIRDLLFPILSEACDEFVRDTQASVKTICELHKHTEEDAARWLSGVRYSPDFSVRAKDMEYAVDVLKQAGVVPENFSEEKLWQRNSVVDVDYLDVARTFGALNRERQRTVHTMAARGFATSMEGSVEHL